MRVKICGIRTEKDVQAVVDADADAAGFLVGQVHPSPDFILPSTAGRLAKRLPPYVSPVLVTHLTEPEAIKELVDKSGINTIQLHGGSSIEEVDVLRKILPWHCKLILTAHVIGDGVEPDFEPYLPFIDAILLDSFNKDTGQYGGTGVPHNWLVSQRIVRNSRKPVILAGGLNPDNVKEAIQAVRPYGVDANSGLRDEKTSGRCPKRCSAFVVNAKNA